VTDKIKACAQRVISLLREKNSLNVLLFPELLRESSVVAYQALGWLAREGRVGYSMKGPHCYLSLAGKEQSKEAR
jgi:hypothetical protein